LAAGGILLTKGLTLMGLNNYVVPHSQVPLLLRWAFLTFHRKKRYGPRQHVGLLHMNAVAKLLAQKFEKPIQKLNFTMILA
jgi:hypothetical protein